MTTTQRRHVRYSTRRTSEDDFARAIRRGAAVAAEMAHATDSPTDELPFRIALEPGDGTLYRLFGTIDARLADPKRWRIYLALLGHGAEPHDFTCDFGPQPDYVADKMRLTNTHTANVLADFLADLIDAIRPDRPADIGTVEAAGVTSQRTGTLPDLDTHPIPESPRKDANAARALDDPCYICGKAVTANDPHWIQVVNGGVDALSWDQYREMDGDTRALLGADPGYMGWHKIGSECRKKLPARFVTQPDK